MSFHYHFPHLAIDLRLYFPDRTGLPESKTFEDRVPKPRFSISAEPMPIGGCVEWLELTTDLQVVVNTDLSQIQVGIRP